MLLENSFSVSDFIESFLKVDQTIGILSMCQPLIIKAVKRGNGSLEKRGLKITWQTIQRDMKKISE